MNKFYEIRDPIHSFITIDEWERDIINHPAFQRLRRIRQLACTDLVYPGATHCRFEHSLGVMHVADRLFSGICQRNNELLESELDYRKEGLKRLRALIRIAALLHDIGHAPFSHPAEEIMPQKNLGELYTHEDYTAAIIKYELRDIIENHPINEKNYKLTIDNINAFYLEKPTQENLLWQSLISGQMDADRMDYLLRDAYHAGVNYGKYDLDRIVATVTLLERPGGEGYTLGVGEDGIHAAEGMLLARYMMFTQVYFHKTRVIYDYHLIEALKAILEINGGQLPPADSKENVKAYLKWDDWKVTGAIAEGKGGEHGKRLKDRQHFRLLRETKEVPDFDDLEKLDKLCEVLKDYKVVHRDAGKSWYNMKEGKEIWIKPISNSTMKGESIPLSYLSPVIKWLQPVRQGRLYIPLSYRDKAEKIAKEYDQKKGGKDEK